MSTAASAVHRSHSASSRPPSYGAATADVPHRTRSVATRPATATQPAPAPSNHSNHRHSYSKSQSYDRRPPANHAVFDNIARRDFESSRVNNHPSRRESSRSRERSRERPSSSYRTDSSSNKPQRNLSVRSHQRDSIDMASAAPPAADAGAGHSQPASGHHLHPANPNQAKRRTMIATPTGQWALGKTLGAGSMGKVKVGRHMATGEQVCLRPHWLRYLLISRSCRSLLRSCLDNLQRSIEARARPKEQTVQKRFGLPVRRPL